MKIFVQKYIYKYFTNFYKYFLLFILLFIIYKYIFFSEEKAFKWDNNFWNKISLSK